MRGQRLRELCSAFNVGILNESGEGDSEDQWTFRSTCGVKRRIDFILASTTLTCKHAMATRFFDLGSDHRAVKATLQYESRARVKRSRQKQLKGWSPEDKDLFQAKLNSRIDESSVSNLLDVERILREESFANAKAKPHKNTESPWDTPYFESLQASRRAVRDAGERKRLTNLIRKYVRQQMRKKKSAKMQNVLEEYKDFHRFEVIRQMPVRERKSLSSNDCTSHVHAEFLSDLFKSTFGGVEPFLQDVGRRMTSRLPDFTLVELRGAIRALNSRRGGDKLGLVGEMFKSATDTFLHALLEVFNGMLAGEPDPSWRLTQFLMFPKGGDRTKPKNWRPIAILRIAYKIFSRMLYQRLQPILDAHQSKDQVGFRQGASVVDAFVTYETVCGKTLEWNVPLFTASLDLKKAFDRVEYKALFEALSAQGVDDAYISLLARLYSHQQGQVSGSKKFSIERGVKQGDVLSPLLFNAALESAIRTWKETITGMGLRVDGGERLTNIRYADDLMIYASSMDELVRMLEALFSALQNIGLEVNPEKCKILANEASAIAIVVDVGGLFIECLTGSETHRYLGRLLAGDPLRRSHVEFSNRCQCAWAKFSRHRDILTDKHISLHSRLKFFDTVVSPTVLFGLAQIPLLREHVDHLDALQRKMLRRIVGWVRIEDESWRTTMSRMKERLNKARNIYCVNEWSKELAKRQFRMAIQISRNSDNWPARCIRWNPKDTNTNAYRNVGRPRVRWDDGLRLFSITKYGNSDWITTLNYQADETEFIQFSINP